MTTQRNRCDGCDDVMPNSNTANQIKVFFSLLFYCRFIIQCISIEKKKTDKNDHEAYNDGKGNWLKKRDP